MISSRSRLVVAAHLAALFSVMPGRSAAAEPTYKIRWILAHPEVKDFEAATKTFAQVVARETNGAVQVVQVVPSADMRFDRVPGAVARGDYEMGQAYSFTLGELVPKFWLFELPFLFDGDAALYKVFDGPLGRALLSSTVSHGLRGLGFTYSGGFQVLATTGRAVHGPEDLKGLRVGVYGNPVVESWLKRFGAVPVPAGARLRGDGPPADAESGSVDAIFRTYAVLLKKGGFAHYPRPSELYATPRVSVIVINEAFYRGLPANYQAAVRKAALVASRTERAFTIRQNEESKLKLLAAGARIETLTPAERAAFRAAARAAYAPFNALFGEDTLRSLAALSAPSGAAATLPGRGSAAPALQPAR